MKKQTQIYCTLKNCVNLKEGSAPLAACASQSLLDEKGFSLSTDAPIITRKPGVQAYWGRLNAPVARRDAWCMEGGQNSGIHAMPAKYQGNEKAVLWTNSWVNKINQVIWTKQTPLQDEGDDDERCGASVVHELSTQQYIRVYLAI